MTSCLPILNAIGGFQAGWNVLANFRPEAEPWLNVLTLLHFYLLNAPCCLVTRFSIQAEPLSYTPRH